MGKEEIGKIYLKNNSLSKLKSIIYDEQNLQWNTSEYKVEKGR